MEPETIKKAEKKPNQPFEFSGKVTDAIKTKVYGPKYRDELYWQLIPDTGKSKVKKLFAFKNTVGEKIWQELESFSYYGKPLVFCVKKYTSVPGNYQLLKWWQI